MSCLGVIHAEAQVPQWCGAAGRGLPLRRTWLLALSLVAATAAPIGCTDPNEEANKLAVDAKAAIARALATPDAEARYRDLIEAQETLDEIVERYPQSDLAVRIVEGESVIGVSRDELLENIDQAVLESERSKGTNCEGLRDCVDRGGF